MAELQSAGKDIALTATPSIMYNNLSTIGDSYVYAHQHDAYIVRPLGPHKIPNNEKDRYMVTSTTSCTARGRALVTLTNNNETQIWDALKDVKVSAIAHGQEAEVRGCAMMESNNLIFLAVGHGSGEVEFFQINEDFSCQSVKRQKAHRGAITCVATSPAALPSPALFASGDTNGDLILWNNQFTSYVAAPSAGDCVTSVAIFGGLVAAGYGSGTIKIFDAASGQMTVEIGAHSRWINGIAYDVNTNRLASVSEDNLVCVWQMPSAQSGNVAFLGHKIHPNRLPTGVAWSADGKQLLVSLYDTDKLVVYQTA